jgi:hypothetical protein
MRGWSLPVHGAPSCIGVAAGAIPYYATPVFGLSDRTINSHNATFFIRPIALQRPPCRGEVKKVDHEFGGHHTELKLSVIGSYLNAYTKALRKIFKQLWYIDAFAGTGSRIVKHRALPANLFGDPPAPERIERLRGSAQIAIDAMPPFDALIFIEKRGSFAAELDKLKSQHPSRNIKVIKGDANEAIQKIVRETFGRQREQCYFSIHTGWTSIGKR